MDVPETPRLAPGLRVVRRGPDHLQIGMYDGRRTLLPRTPVVVDTLADLLERRPVAPTPDRHRVLARLGERGCLVDLDDLRRRESLRRAARVLVLGAVAQERELLASTGVRLVGPDRPADVVLVASNGELDRDRLDPLIRASTPHLVCRLVDGSAVLGPFVVPGVTACLRCIDAQLSVADPDHAVVAHRYAQATAQARSDGLEDVDDLLLGPLAAAWAVRDVVAHLEGRLPATWSRTLTFGPAPSPGEQLAWARHPECGCSWSAHAAVSGTMGT